jgi:YNFM family putative membrane transporter
MLSKNARVGIIIITTILTFSALYAPQPIQPLIMEYFGVSQSASALLTTATMLPLGIAPIFYGYLLEAVSARRMLIISISILAVSQIIFFLSNSFTLLVILRGVQGLVIPAILTGIMTYISTVTDKSNIQKVMSVYISATIMGGFAGRFFSGLISHYGGWRMMFLILGVSLAVSAYLMSKLDENKASMTKLNKKAVFEVLADRRFTVTYIIIFSMFFMFAALLNFIPFRMREIDPSSSAMLIGVMYTGYVMGVIVSLNVMKVIKIFRGEFNAIFAGLTMFVFSLMLFNITDIKVMFLGMFIFCAGMFMAHSIASGYLNKLADSNKGVTNGLYVAFYYAGGTIGSILPGIVYENYNWQVFLIFIGSIMFSTMLFGRIALRKYI